MTLYQETQSIIRKTIGILEGGRGDRPVISSCHNVVIFKSLPHNITPTDTERAGGVIKSDVEINQGKLRCT